MATPAAAANDNNDHLVQSEDPDHPANLIASLCAKFWTLGWVTGTGGGCSIRKDDLVYIAPSGVQKELMRASDMYVLALSAQDSSDPRQRTYLRRPARYKPSSCTPLFLAAFSRRDARCCIHTHSQWAVLVTLILETRGPGYDREFRINNLEQIKAFGRGPGKAGNLDNFDTLVVPVVDNTPHEEELTGPMAAVMDQYPDTYAVLVRRHGVYVWGDTVEKAKAMCESLDYLFQLAVEMRKLGLPWISDPRLSVTSTE